MRYFSRTEHYRVSLDLSWKLHRVNSVFFANICFIQIDTPLRKFVASHPNLVGYGVATTLISNAAWDAASRETASFALCRSAFKSVAVHTCATDRGRPHRQAPETFS
jgi:hypothetical protein